ncbi:MAG TPA: hypothetical protein VFE47_04675, partial [Tepidisphaeraceae bacterium]|nr:hypothetical protein [Tepidisphaeraceae bacterium]
QIARQRIKMVGLHYTRLAEQTRAGRARMRKSGEKFGENRSKCESRVRPRAVSPIVASVDRIF